MTALVFKNFQTHGSVQNWLKFLAAVAPTLDLSLFLNAKHVSSSRFWSGKIQTWRSDNIRDVCFLLGTLLQFGSWLISSKMLSRRVLVTTVNGSCWMLPRWSLDLICSSLKRWIPACVDVSLLPPTALLAVAARGQPSRSSHDLSSFLSFLKLIPKN